VATTGLVAETGRAVGDVTVQVPAPPVNRTVHRVVEPLVTATVPVGAGRAEPKETE